MRTNRTRAGWASTFLLFTVLTAARADEGQAGAAFLDIPVGARPAALAGAYAAIATDAYAPFWNPAGLGFLGGTQFSAMHLSYLGGMSYEFISLVDPLTPGHSLGASVQYFNTGTARGM